MLSAGRIWYQYNAYGNWRFHLSNFEDSIANLEADAIANFEVNVTGRTASVNVTILGNYGIPNGDVFIRLDVILAGTNGNIVATETLYANAATANTDPIYAILANSPYTPASDPTAQAAKACGNPNDNPGGCSVGEPINVGTGNVYDEVTDYETAGPNKLNFIRYYNSRSNPSPFALPLGQNWRSNYDRYLWVISGTVVAAERADGQVIYFTSNGSTWTSDSDVGLKLTQAGTTWQLTDREDTVETYATVPNSTEAVLTAVQSRNGYTQTLSYDTNSLLTTVKDSYNRTISLGVQNGLLQTVTTPDGLVLTYGYDVSGQITGTMDRLRTVTYSTAPQTSLTYLYENTGLPYAITGIIDENGNRFASWTYDQYSRGLSSQFGAGALLTTVAYNDADGSRTVTNALGQPEVYKFTTLQGIPKVTEIDRVATATTAAAAKTFTYDGNGYTASESDWNGNVTAYVNDVLGRPTTIVEASGTNTERTTTISYFQNYHLPARIVAPQVTTDFMYDASGNLLTKKLTDTTTTAVPYRTNGQTRIWNYTWANGLLTSVQNPRTDVAALTSFGYDGSGALVKTTNALGQTVQITRRTPGGLPLTIKDANGVTTQFTYDAHSARPAALSTPQQAISRRNTGMIPPVI